MLRNEMFVSAAVLLCCMDLTGRWIDVNEVSHHDRMPLAHVLALHVVNDPLMSVRLSM